MGSEEGPGAGYGGDAIWHRAGNLARLVLCPRALGDRP